MKSILQEKDGRCYLCMQLNGDYAVRGGLQEHHAVFGTAGRRLSERYGLKVYLCPQHHVIGSMAVHNNHELAGLLQKKAQEAFEETHTHEEWMDIFGRDYR